MGEDEREIDDTAELAVDSGQRLGGFTVGIIFGAALGAGLALMLAPERGETTRRRLRRRLERLRDDAGDGVGRAKAITRREVLRRRRDPS